MVNGEEKGETVEVKKAYFHELYKNKTGKEASRYDFGVLELEKGLERSYGYLGIDTRMENIKLQEKIEMYGYPSNKKNRLCFGEGGCKGFNDDLILYSIPTRGGQSGGPIIRREGDKEYVIGVHIAGEEKLLMNGLET